MEFVNKKLNKKYKKIHKEFCQLFDRQTKFFSHKNIPPSVVKEMEENWPDRFYKGAFYFEGWPVKDLLTQAMAIGYEMGKYPKKRKALALKMNNLGKKLDLFKFKINKREYFGVNLLKVVPVDKESIALHYENKPISYTKVDFQKFTAAWRKWERKTNKLLKSGKI